VSFPDFPGVATAGTSLNDVQAMAEEALALHVDGLVEYGEAFPEPPTLDAVMELSAVLEKFRIAGNLIRG
jgi:predicted RNase H-like HicB family nuclease